MTLKEILLNHGSDARIKLYRMSKTKATPKGSSALKKAIPSYTPAGDYGANEPRVATSPLIESTGLVQLDFDIEITDKRIDQLFKKYKWVAVASRSCGGKGCYLLVNTPSPKYYGEYFGALVEFFEREEKMIVDPAVSSINELRFVSLTSEVRLREDATEWTERAAIVVSRFKTIPVAHNGKIVKPTDDGDLHYGDLISLVGTNNANGTPLDKVIEFYTPDKFGEASHLRTLSHSAVASIITNLYDRYADQHGVARTPTVKLKSVRATPVDDVEATSLAAVEYKGNDSMEFKALVVVSRVLESYPLRTDHLTRVTYKYDDHYWQKVEDYKLKEFLTQCSYDVQMDAKLCELTTFRELMVRQLKDMTSTDMTSDRTKFNLANGVLRFDDEGVIEFTAHDAAHNFRYRMEYSYDPAAVCPRYDSFINRVMPNEDDQKLLYNYIVSMFHKTREEHMLFLIGSGANGKSTIFDMVTNMFGEVASTCNLFRLTDPQHSAIEAYKIYGKLIAVSHDDKGIKDPELFKTIASRDPLSMKILYKDLFVTNDYARLMIGMNSYVRIENTHGAQRRIKVIEMSVRIPDNERDTGLRDKLKLECSGILNYLVDAHQRQEKAEMSEQGKAFLKELEDHSDDVAQFLQEKAWTIVDPETADRGVTPLRVYMRSIGAEITGVNEMYLGFQEFCKETGVRYPLGRKAFSKRLKDKYGDTCFTKENDATKKGYWVAKEGL